MINGKWRDSRDNIVSNYHLHEPLYGIQEVQNIASIDQSKKEKHSSNQAPNHSGHFSDILDDDLYLSIGRKALFKYEVHRQPPEVVLGLFLDKRNLLAFRKAHTIRSRLISTHALPGEPESMTIARRVESVFGHALAQISPQNDSYKFHNRENSLHEVQAKRYDTSFKNHSNADLSKNNIDHTENYMKKSHLSHYYSGAMTGKLNPNSNIDPAIDGKQHNRVNPHIHTEFVQNSELVSQDRRAHNFFDNPNRIMHNSNDGVPRNQTCENKRQYDLANQQQRGDKTRSYNVVPDEQNSQNRQSGLHNFDVPVNPNQMYENKRQYDLANQQQRGDKTRSYNVVPDEQNNQNRQIGLHNFDIPVNPNQMYENERQYDLANQQQRGVTMQSYNVVPDEKNNPHRQSGLDNFDAPVNPNQTYENRNHHDGRFHQQGNDTTPQSERRVEGPKYQHKGSGVNRYVAPMHPNHTHENKNHDETGYQQRRGGTKQYDMGQEGKEYMLTTNINRFPKNDPAILYGIENKSESYNGLSSISSSYDHSRNKKKIESNSTADQTLSFSESEGVTKEKRSYQNTDDECSDVKTSKRCRNCTKIKHSSGKDKPDKKRITERKCHSTNCGRGNVLSKRSKNKKAVCTTARRSVKKDVYLAYGEKNIEPIDSCCSSHSNIQEDTTCSSNMSDISGSEKKFDLKRQKESLKPSIYHSMDIAIRKYKLARKEAQADKARSKLLTELKNEIRNTKQILRFTTEETQKDAYSRHLVDLENELTKWNQTHSLDTCTTLTKIGNITDKRDTYQRGDIILDEMSSNTRESTANDIYVTKKKEKERPEDKDQNLSTTHSKEIILDQYCQQTKVIKDHREYANIIAPIAMKENFTFTAKKDDTVFLAKVVRNPSDSNRSITCMVTYYS